MKFIQKQLVASEPFQMHDPNKWVCNVFEVETNEKAGTFYGKTCLEAQSAAMIFVKAEKILHLVNDILTGKDNA